MKKKLLVVVTLVGVSLLLGGCLHTVTFGLDAGAHWHVKPTPMDVH